MLNPQILSSIAKALPNAKVFNTQKGQTVKIAKGIVWVIEEGGEIVKWGSPILRKVGKFLGKVPF